MSLRIKHQGETFLVEGNINSTTLKQFKNHLEFLLSYTKELTIDLNGVKGIDNDGVNVLKELYFKAITINKKFSIIGNAYQEICDDFHFN